MRYGRRFVTTLLVLVIAGQSVGNFTEKSLDSGASWGGLVRVGCHFFYESHPICAQFECERR